MRLWHQDLIPITFMKNIFVEELNKIGSGIEFIKPL